MKAEAGWSGWLPATPQCLARVGTGKIPVKMCSFEQRAGQCGWRAGALERGPGWANASFSHCWGPQSLEASFNRKPSLSLPSLQARDSEGLGAGPGVAGTAVIVGRAAIFCLGDPFPAAPRRPGTLVGFLPEASLPGHWPTPGLTSLGLPMGERGQAGAVTVSRRGL